MKDPILSAQEQITALIGKAFADAQAAGLLPEGEPAEFRVEIPADRSHGDFSTNAAMVNARAFRRAPAMIADALVKSAQLDGTYFEKIETAGPGFINFTLGSKYYTDILKKAAAEGADYGKSDHGKGKRVLVEFVSANPTGPMHVGNARGGAIGDCLAETLTWAGYYTEREFYVNDAGNQIEKFGLSLDIRYREIFDPSVEMPEDSYHGADIIEHANAFAAIHGDAYLNRSEEERRRALVEFALPKNIEGLERDLLSYRIKYDTWFRESTLHADGSVKDIIERLKANGYTYEKDGALWLKAEQFGCDKDFVLVRSNGIPTYIVPDIAYHYNKLVIRKFDTAINVLGADHHGYVPRMKAALQALGIDPERLKVVLMQMVRLINKDGEVIKASKRSGKAITLVTLLDEVPTDAARFFFNLREPNTHCDFNLDLAVEQSSQNPVYYCQYAHARICSILAKLCPDGAECIPDDSLDSLTASEERELIRHIGALPQQIVAAAAALDPSAITRYALELAALFHKFYNACRCDVAEREVKNARLFLCKTVRDIMKNILGLMKIDAPEKM
ncbi:MAG: arginine--tRNA ligase [Clostridia bacterium]|nr:arginine--tRNA ligase [Clostridia bacterium]